MVERRRHGRSRAFAAGTLGSGAQSASTDCVVRDLSAGGALLLLDDPQRAPAEVSLALGGELRPGRVVWRGRTGVGVAFAGAPAANVVSLDAARLARAGDARRLEDRIARFVGSTRPA